MLAPVSMVGLEAMHFVGERQLMNSTSPLLQGRVMIGVFKAPTTLSGTDIRRWATELRPSSLPPCTCIHPSMACEMN